MQSLKLSRGDKRIGDQTRMTRSYFNTCCNQTRLRARRGMRAFGTAIGTHLDAACDAEWPDQSELGPRIQGVQTNVRAM